MYFQLALTHATNIFQVLLRLDKTVTDLSLRYGTNEQEKMNHRPGVLTISLGYIYAHYFFSGYFWDELLQYAPVSFYMGYPMALVVIAGVALGLYFYFKKEGWLD